MALATTLRTSIPYVLVALSASSLPVFAYDWVPNPQPKGNWFTGWQDLPDIPGAQLIDDWPVPGTDSVMVGA